MPRLPTYTAEVGGLPIHGGRRATAEDAGAGIGAAVQQFGHIAQRAADDYLTRQEQDEERTAIVQNQQIRARYSEELRKAELEGGDLEKIRERFDRDVSDVEANFSTRRGRDAATRYGAVSSEAFRDVAAAIDVRRSGRKLAQQAKDFDSAASAQMQLDPSQLDRILAEREELINTYAGRVPPELLDQAKQDGRERLTVSSVNSVIEADPNLALRLLQDPEHTPWGSLTPEARAALINGAQAAVKAQRYDEERAKALAKEEQRKSDDEAMDRMLQDFSKGAGGNWTQRQILGMQGVSPNQRLRMTGVLEALTREPKSDPAAANEAYRRIFLPDSDPNKIARPEQIDDLLIRREISPQDHSAIRGALARAERPTDKVIATFISRMERLLSPRGAMGETLEPDGELRTYEFRQYVASKVAEYEERGWDVRKLFDPTSAEYLGKDVVNFLPDIRKEQVAKAMAVREAQQTLQRQQAEMTEAERETARISGRAATMGATPALPRVDSPAEAAKLPPGTRFIGPDGIERTRR